MGILLQFALETALLNVFGWVTGAAIAASFLGPKMIRKGYQPLARWLTYSVIAASVGLASFLYFDSDTGGAAGAALAWIAMLFVSAPFIAAAMAISKMVRRKQ